MGKQGKEDEIALINQENIRYLKDQFSTFTNPVNLIYFHSKKQNAEHCIATKTILDEIDPISSNVNVTTIDFDTETEQVKHYRIMKPPAIAIQSDIDRGLRYYGIPSGYEFSTLVHSLSLLGKEALEVSPELREWSQAVNQKVEILVFVTSACPHCPRAASMAHKFALLNDHIEGTVIEANSFPELTRTYDVMAVPKTIINKARAFEGTVHEQRFAEEISKSISV